MKPIRRPAHYLISVRSTVVRVRPDATGLIVPNRSDAMLAAGGLLLFLGCCLWAAEQNR